MKFKAALIQMRSGREPARNFADASEMIRAAKAQDRTIKAELANARGVLAKLQSIAI